MYFVSLKDSMANNLIQYLLKFLRELLLKVLYLLNKFNESKIFIPACVKTLGSYHDDNR